MSKINPFFEDAYRHYKRAVVLGLVSATLKGVSNSSHNEIGKSVGNLASVGFDVAGTYNEYKSTFNLVYGIMYELSKENVNSRAIEQGKKYIQKYNLMYYHPGIIIQYPRVELNGEIPEFKSDVTKFDSEIENMIKASIKEYEINFDDLKITEGVTSAMNLVARANKYIDETAPWVLAKEGKTEELKSVMSHLANVLYVSSILLSPVLVHQSKNILDQLGIPESLRNYQSINKIGVIEKFKVKKGNQLFPRLDSKKEIDYIKGLMK